MSGPYRVLAYLLAANVEAVVLMFAASFAADWLEDQYPQNFEWLPITIALAFLGIVHSWYRVIKLIQRQELGDQKSAKDSAQKLNKKA